MTIANVATCVDWLLYTFSMFWNYLDSINITLGGVGFTLLQLFVGAYVVDWLIVVFFMAYERDNTGGED